MGGVGDAALANLMRPEATYRFVPGRKGSPPRLMPPAGLGQSLFLASICEINATDASRTIWIFAGAWDAQWIKLTFEGTMALACRWRLQSQIGRPFHYHQGPRGLVWDYFSVQASRGPRAGGTCVKLYKQ